MNTVLAFVVVATRECSAINLILLNKETRKYLADIVKIHTKVVRTATNDRIVTEHYFGNVLHNNIGPARIVVSNHYCLVIYYRYGLLHRTIGPAVAFGRYLLSEIDSNDFYVSILSAILTFQTRILSMEMYYQFGCLHRDDGPAKSSINHILTGEFCHTKSYYCRGILQGIRGKPSKIIIQSGKYPSNIITYHRNGMIHRDNGPAFIKKKFSVCLNLVYYKNGRLHRINGPAMTLYSYEMNDGKRRTIDWEKHWYNHDEEHKIRGPSYTRMNGDFRYMIDGKAHRFGGKSSQYTVKRSNYSKTYSEWNIYGKLIKKRKEKEFY